MCLQELPLAHSFNEGQIEWFKAGSALNLVRFTLSLSVDTFTDATLTTDGCQRQGQAVNACAKAALLPTAPCGGPLQRTLDASRPYDLRLLEPTYITHMLYDRRLSIRNSLHPQLLLSSSFPKECILNVLCNSVVTLLSLAVIIFSLFECDVTNYLTNAKENG